MMKKITLFLFVLLCSMTAMAQTTTNYNGTMTTTGNNGTIVDNNAVITLEDDGRGVYKMTIENFNLYLMGETYELGTMVYSNMMAMPDDDDENLMVISGSQYVNFLDYMDLGDLGLGFGGMDPGMLGSMIGANFPISMEAKFNETTMTANFQCTVKITMMDYYTLLEEPVTKEFVGAVPQVNPDPALYLIGSFNEWNDEAMVPLTLGDDGKWTITQAMDADAEFKLKDENDNWLGGVSEGNFIVTQEQVNEGTPLTLSNPGMNFQIPVAGTWTLTVDKENMNLVISGEWSEPAPEPVDVYILGEVADNGDIGWAPNVGQKMNYDEETGLYTAEVSINDYDESGYDYFSFTTELAEYDDQGGWDYIVPFRFGALSEGDFLVTNDMLDIDLSLTYNDGQAFKIPPGDYTLTVNLVDMTLMINKNGTTPVELKPGDVNGDGVVDVADVNAAINIILEIKTEADYNGNADLTDDGVVDVSDVNAIINIILTQ